MKSSPEFMLEAGTRERAACLLLAHLCGPPAQSRPNSQLFSAAQSRDQAGIIFSLAAKMVRMNPVLSRAVTIRETAKELICRELGTRYRALSGDATTAFGLSPAMGNLEKSPVCPKRDVDGENAYESKRERTRIIRRQFRGS